MFNLVRNSVLLIAVAALMSATPSAQSTVDRAAVLAAMKKATTFMVEKVAHKGGYVWSYLPDMSRQWGEMEAKKTMIWIQPPGTPSMGHLYLDAYHATQDEYYYRAAEQVAAALAAAQHPSGGWNYIYDFAGEASLKDWYNTIGKNAWRLEEFQHYYGNATFDDAGTAEAAKFFLRLYVEKKDPKYRVTLDKAIAFVLDSQYPIGLWPQRFPRVASSGLHGLPDYTGHVTFNDDVAAENIDFLVLCYQALGDGRLLDPIVRAMNAFISTQLGPPQPGWGLQHTLDLKPSGARTYEPNALVTHITANNLSLLIRFYRLTGETKFLARVPEGIAWLESVALPPGVAPPGRTHPTFIELGTNEPLYVHREGSNVFSGRYFVNKDPKNTIGHYSAFRAVDTAGLRKAYESARSTAPEELVKTSPLKQKPGTVPMPKYYTLSGPAGDAAKVTAALNAEGYWLAPLGFNSHPYKQDGAKVPQPGNLRAEEARYATTHVGDDTDTSPFPDPKLMGISIEAYVRNMGVLIRALGSPN